MNLRGTTLVLDFSSTYHMDNGMTRTNFSLANLKGVT